MQSLHPEVLPAYLVGVHAGPEIYKGVGSFETRFALNIAGGGDSEMIEGGSAVGLKTDDFGLELELWVSPTGDDSAAGTRQAPLQHMHVARDRLRELRSKKQKHRATVRLLPGAYQLNQTLELVAADSFTTWQADDAGSLRGMASLPLISGGVPLTWTREEGSSTAGCTILSASHVPTNGRLAATGAIYPELYIAGQGRAAVAKQPADALTNPEAFFEWSALEPASLTAFSYDTEQVNPADLASDGSLSDVTAMISNAPWAFVPGRINKADNGTLTLMQALGPKPLSNSKLPGKHRWVALNTQRGDLLPGTYRFNSKSNRLTFCTNISSPVGVVAAPHMTTLVSVQGDATGVSFDSLRFSHSAVGDNPSPYSYDAPSTAAVEISNATTTTFTSCAFTSTGANGLQVRHGVKGVVVQQSVFADIGGRGFTTTLEHTSAAQDAVDITLKSSVFKGCGRVFMQQPFCIFVSGKKNITVAHNDVSEVPYTAIRVWSFDVEGSRADAFFRGVPVFNISHNHVHDVGMGLLSDFGAIFVTTRPSSGDCVVGWGEERCGVSALVDSNVVHNVRHYDHSGIGLYTDESSGMANLTRNLVFDCGSWGLHLHCGRRHLVRGNIFAGNAAQLPDSGVTSDKERGDYAAEPFCNFKSHGGSSQGAVIEKNIFDQHDAPFAGVGRSVSIFNNRSNSSTSVYGNISNTQRGMAFHSNLYSFAGHSASAQFPGGLSLRQWQKETGQDSGSVTGSPGFALAQSTLGERRDYRVLASRSAAIRAVGFVPLDLSLVGPQGVLPLVECANDGGDSGEWWRGCELAWSA